MSSLLATPVSNWDAACATIILNANISKGFVGQDGNPMSSLTNYTWGVTKEVCDEYCGGKIYQAFDFNVFATAFTGWLLPWLALTAQLPFEAKSPVGNLMSLCMAVGSPALITYSLTLTILNRIWVRRIFGSLIDRLDDLPENLRQGLRKRLRAAQYLLQESQQVAMRTSQVDGWLSSLIALDENDPWWMRVKKDLKNTRRGYTFSLLAQILMAFLAYTLTIAITLNSSPLGNSEGSGVLLTAGGGIWIWMIPVILGWIMCGTQARARSITDALNDKTHFVFRRNMRGEIVQSHVQHGIFPRSGLIPRPRFLELPFNLQATPVAPRGSGSPSVGGPEHPNGAGVAETGELNGEMAEFDEISRFRMAGDSSVDEKIGISDVTVLKIEASKTTQRPLGEFIFDYEMLRIPSWLGFSIEGDEAREGPIFNYARLFTFREFSSTITKGFVANIASLKAGNTQRRNSVDVAESCQLDKVLLQAYTPWREIDSTVWHHTLIAAGAAIFVQWGTTGPAIMIAYLTPTVGLGCRSGGYLIYGVAATISWALLFGSSLLSHAVILIYQDIYMGRRPLIPRKKNKDLEGATESIQMLPMDQFAQESDPANLSAHRRTLLHSTLAFLAVASRLTGKLIATANACWIVIAALFEYTGVYSTCWCETDAAALGSRAWAVLFATSESFATVARNSWVGGVIFSFGVCICTYVAFFLGCKRNDVDEYDG